MNNIIKNAAKISIGIIDPLYIKIYKLIHNIEKPIPPFENRRRVGNTWIKDFLRAGYNCYVPLKEAILSRTDRPISDLRILDFGSGVGRTLQYFYSICPTIYACDVDNSAIKYLKDNFPKSLPSLSKFEPPLEYSDALFDVVYSVSIWTHLPIELQEMWLKEIQRILKPRGIALITTSGFAALKVRRNRDVEWRNIGDEHLKNEGIIYREYPDFLPEGKDYPGIKSSYGLTAHSPQYIRNNWSKYFIVEEIREGVIDNVQDVVIMRKK